MEFLNKTKKVFAVFTNSYINLAIIFVLLAGLFGAIFVFTTPLLWGVDEITQFSRALNISEGHIIAQKLPSKIEGYGGNVPTNLLNLWSNVSYNLTHPPSNGVHIFYDNSVQNEIGSQHFSKVESPINFSNTAVYSPVVYAPSIAGIYLSNLLNLNIYWTIILARLATLGFYILFIYFAIKSLIKTRAKWIVFTVGLVPMVLFQASIVNADAVTNAVIFLFTALFIKASLLKLKLNRFESWTLIVTALAIPIVKPSYILFSFLLLLVPFEKLYFKRPRLYTYLSLITGILLFAIWTYLTKAEASSVKLFNVVGSQYVDSKLQIKYIISHFNTDIILIPKTLLLNDLNYLLSSLGYLGFAMIQVPAISIIGAVISMVLGALITENWVAKKITKFSMILVTIASFLGILLVLYVTFTQVGLSTVQGIQGRYFIPLFMLALVCFSMTGIRLLVKTAKQYRMATYTMTILTVLSLLGAVIKYIYVIKG